MQTGASSHLLLSHLVTLLQRCHCPILCTASDVSTLLQWKRWPRSALRTGASSHPFACLPVPSLHHTSHTSSPRRTLAVCCPRQHAQDRKLGADGLAATHEGAPTHPTPFHTSSPRRTLAVRCPRQHAQDRKLGADSLAAARWGTQQHVVISVVEGGEHLGLDWVKVAQAPLCK